MMTALVATGLLPVVFLAALAQSAESHPRPMREVLAEISRPIVDRIEGWIR